MSSAYGDSSFDQREQIRDAIDVVDLVERYVPLRRQGANFVGRCPWHDDSRPSLQVNPTRQTFKCWVCNIGGDVFSFVMRIENVDFKESMQILADIAGIELVKPRKKQRRIRATTSTPRLANEADASSTLNEQGAVDAPSDYSEPPRDVPKPVLYRSLEWLAQKYRDAYLNSPEAELAREYVRSRGINEASSEKFQIGYSPLEYDSILSQINWDRERARILEATGTLAYRDEYDDSGRLKPRKFERTSQLADYERRRYYDRFRGRLIFPIRDVQDRVVAFGGRVIPNSPVNSPAKYVNSPETAVFVKSKTLYGLDRARNAIRKTGRAIITEGYTDCIVASQFGFENAVAALGTALGAEHVRILKRFADKMTLLLDGDEAGRKRAKEVLRFFVEQGVDMNVLTLPDDDDPCEFLLEKGADAFRDELEHRAIDALDHAFNTAIEGIDLETDVVGAAKALDSLLDVVALFPERARANDPARLRALGALQRFAARFRVDEKELLRIVEEKRANARRFADRDRAREERRRNDDASAPREPLDPEEARVKEYRERWVYPVASEDEETDEQLRSLFPPFESEIWENPRLAPTALEREYLELWFAAPSLYPRLVAQIPNEALRSPIAKQIDLLGRDALEQGREPTFELVMLRYEDERMKNFLIELDANGEEKKLSQTTSSEETREALLRDLFDGFERVQARRDAAKRASLLRDKDASDEEKLDALLELRKRKAEQAKQRTRNSFDDENV